VGSFSIAATVPWHPTETLLDSFSLLVEMDRAPARRVVQFAPLVERQVLAIVDVWLEARCIFAKDSTQLVLNACSRHLKLLKPWKLLARVELGRLQAGEITPERQPRIPRCDPRRASDEVVDPAALGGRALAARVGGFGLYVDTQVFGVLRLYVTGVAHRCLGRCFAELIRGRVGECHTIRGRRLPRLPQLLEKRGAHQERQGVMPFEAQCLAQRGFRTGKDAHGHRARGRLVRGAAFRGCAHAPRL